ncbi:serine hydrolase [Patescibacteria group bacterium]|nr:serine hydrolase [Patescibacteria group bacterium]
MNIDDIARLNLILAGVVFIFANIVFVAWPQPTTSAYSALASPYCLDRSLSVDMQANAGYAKDLTTGEVIYQKNATAQLPLASLTKLMTVYTALQTLGLEDEVKISADAMRPEGNGLAQGEVWTAGELADYTLLSSVNDGARALLLASIEKNGGTYETFIDAMNTNARSMGLAQTYFANETGLDISETVGASYGSAEDITLLFEYLYRNNPRLLEATTKSEKTFDPLSGTAHLGKNTSSLIATLPGALGSKTGFTDIAGGNLGIVFEALPGRPVVAVVLGSTREGRDEDMKMLAEGVKKWMTRMLVCQDDS